MRTRRRLKTAPRGLRARYTADVYLAKDGWRWHMKARNGRIIAESGEAYVSERAVTTAFHRVRFLFNAEFRDRTRN